MWTDKAHKRFKERIQEITNRSRGVPTFCMLRELKRYVVGWMNYFGISQLYRVVPELDQWMRRRVRMYYWKQWKRARKRRRQLIRLGIHPAEVYKAHTQPPGLLVYGRDEHCSAGTGQSLAGGEGSAKPNATIW